MMIGGGGGNSLSATKAPILRWWGSSSTLVGRAVDGDVVFGLILTSGQVWDWARCDCLGGGWRTVAVVQYLHYNSSLAGWGLS